MEFRLRSGEPVRVETYLAAHPELADDRRATLGLIAAEYELRRLHEGDMDFDEYRRRFPQYLDDLAACLHSTDDDTLGPPTGTARTTVPETPAVPGYEILGELGRGGMGVVYKAREVSLGRQVALKFLPDEYARDPDRLERFLHEARTASALNHPHICTVHALEEHKGRPFLVLELIEGQTLHDLLASQPGVEEVSRLIGQAARALAAAHAAGVVHRDIKPENIMVRPDGYVKVLDFGLARMLPTLTRPEPSKERDTDPGAVLGTAAYMSPEQARGEPADSASDIFSLGIVLYQLATGEHPFEAESALGLLYAIATRQPVPPSRLNPDIPLALEGLIGAMLHKDARLRPTAAEVEAALAVDHGFSHPDPASTARPIVRREPELKSLRAALARAAAGHGALVCVAGEPGIGKTTLVESFLAELNSPGRPCLVARGQCSERLADTEAYLPVIDALGNLLRGEGGDAATRLLKVVAPAWYAQLMPPGGTRSQPPGDDTESNRDPSSLLPANSQQAMLREFCNFLREASRLGTVVLFFDDVHWADVSTVDLLAHLGRQALSLRLLVVVTYRPTELLLGPHPFHRVKLELQGKGACPELALDFLTRADVDRYLALAFPGHAFSDDFAELVYSRTEGSPLFLVDLLRYLRERGVISESGGRWSLARELPDLRRECPGSVRGMIERKLDRLEAGDRRLLAAAAVQGPEFDSAVVAAALNQDAADVEERLQVLDRVHGLVRLVRESEFPDRTLTLRYAFVHALYQQALYLDLTPTRRATLGAALARALEDHHGADSPAAAELACLYEVGRDFGRAARHFWVAAQNTARVFAHHKAIELARRGLRLLEALPETPERAMLELPLQMTLGLQLQVIQGYAAPDAERAYRRACDLCPPDAGSGPPFPVLWGLWLFHKVRSELPRAREMADELFALAQRLRDPNLALQAHQALGITAFCRGEPAAALRHVEQATALYHPERHRTHSFLFGQDPGVICTAYGAVALWLLGHADQAQQQSANAIAMSRALSPNSQAVALFFAGMLHQLRRNAARAHTHADATCFVASEHGFSFWLAGGSVLSGWALAATGALDEGADRLRQGLRDWAATGSVTYRTYYLALLADVLARRGQVPEGLDVLAESLALVEQTGEGLFEAELHRLRGELLLQYAASDEPTQAEAEACFQRAGEVATRQGARALELRALMSLTRLHDRQGRGGAARSRLAECYAAFTEGFDTADLREAKALLEAPV
jgi:serine/threonine protein kinase/predicted ATPase